MAKIATTPWWRAMTPWSHISPVQMKSSKTTNPITAVRSALTYPRLPLFRVRISVERCRFFVYVALVCQEEDWCVWHVFLKSLFL
jgi:hypothetical protein